MSTPLVQKYNQLNSCHLLRYSISNNKPTNKHLIDSIRHIGRLNPFHFIISLVLIVTLSPSHTSAQTVNPGALPPIVSLILFDNENGSQCPDVTPNTTILLDHLITNQEELNALQGITRIEGSLGFSNVSLMTLDFSPLNSLIEVNGDINFDTPLLKSLAGFNCLKSISGSLDIKNNNELTTILGFNALTSLGGLQQTNGGLFIVGNSQLSTIPEFPALNSIDGDLVINQNNSIASISGFQFLNQESVSGNIIINNNSNLDCTNPTPNFTPVTTSSGNAVNCLLSNISINASPSGSIPDNDDLGISSTITISGITGTVDSLTLDLDISHTFVGDLTVTLSNGSQELILIQRPSNPTITGSFGCPSNDITSELDDNALLPINSNCDSTGENDAFPEASYMPLNPLSAFQGNDINGTWTLNVVDSIAASDGTLNTWGLNFSQR